MKYGRQSGFTYLMLLWWVTLSGFMLMALSHSWSLDSRREREAEMVFRAEQIRAAIESYQRAPGAAEGRVRLPSHLQDLLEDKTGPKVIHHLRQLWPDPLTVTGDWGLIKDGELIKGVYSRATQKPIRPPEGVSAYQDWKFMATAGAKTN